MFCGVGGVCHFMEVGVFDIRHQVLINVATQGSSIEGMNEMTMLYNQNLCLHKNMGPNG